MEETKTENMWTWSGADMNNSEGCATCVWIVFIFCDLRQDPAKLMVGYPQHHRNIQNFFPLKKHLGCAVQEVTIHNGSKEDFQLNMWQRLSYCTAGQRQAAEGDLRLPSCGQNEFSDQRIPRFYLNLNMQLWKIDIQHSRVVKTEILAIYN